eukprot:evm.model.scf_28.5 EVM.evm.TU.scf_28.5   scf_28:95880-97314(-)
MAALSRLVPILLLLALAATETRASCDSADVCCSSCTDECPDPLDRIECTKQCTGVDCSDAQTEQCGSGNVCCDDCEAECPGFPTSCASNCVDFGGLGCPEPPPECSTPNEVRCEDCATRCTGYPATCEEFCKKEGIEDGTECLKRGEAQAARVAGRACLAAKAACAIPTLFTGNISTADDGIPISLKDCCLVVIGTCAGDVVKKHPCDTGGNYGTCKDAKGFLDEYTKQAEEQCKTSICSTPACKVELAGSPECSLG